jgi:peptide/nickel transport system permease protein
VLGAVYATSYARYTRAAMVEALGLIALNAFGNGDLPVIMGSVLYASFLLVALNIVIDIDIVCSFLDPRVRLG